MYVLLGNKSIIDIWGTIEVSVTPQGMYKKWCRRDGRVPIHPQIDFSVDSLSLAAQDKMTFLWRINLVRRIDLFRTGVSLCNGICLGPSFSVSHPLISVIKILNFTFRPGTMYHLGPVAHGDAKRIGWAKRDDIFSCGTCTNFRKLLVIEHE